VKKGIKLGKKEPKKSINRGGQLIFTIAIWKIVKRSKTPFVKNVNSKSYSGQKTFTLAPSKYKSPHISFQFILKHLIFCLGGVRP
jgi:hypothetical protein